MVGQISLIIWGLNDLSVHYTLGMSFYKIISSVVDRARFHFFNQCGYSPYGEYLDEVSRLVVDFIKNS